MMAAGEVKRWLNTIPDESGVSVDYGGLMLVTTCGAHLEVGGELQEDEEEDDDDLDDFDDDEDDDDGP